MNSYFDKLNENQVSQFRKWQKIGYFKGSDEDILSTVYIGNRSGKDVFLRFYDKTEEVLSMGYKQFFYEIWHEQGLISLYDKIVYEDSFVNSKDIMHTYISRLKFYFDYGINKEFKSMCKYYIDNKLKVDFDEIIELADKLTPKLTVIVNCEYETQRKFYKSLEEFVKNNLITSCPAEDVLYNCFNILDNQSVILNYLTSKTFRLVKRSGNKRKTDCDYSSFWKILRKVAIDNKLCVKLVRDYQRQVDIERIENDILKKIATRSILADGMSSNDSNIFDDTEDFLSIVSENYFEKYNQYKSDKYIQIKHRL
ncbi:hypothetical protein AN642_00720 [Epulopiscium sp. SCG-B10WGA-EpuloA2]|nr:hypothetical protein AN642_00720 [Epulopiscium sp. SCG-B10WGA-EpuloA2]